MAELLEIKKVSKSFGGVIANHDISLTVPHGKIVGLIGPNGSGKTTLFSSIVGYHAIDSGSISFAGQAIDKMRVPQIARLGMIRTFQQTRVYSQMNCLQNLEISVSQKQDGLLDMMRKYPSEVAEKAKEILAFVGLYSKRFLRAGELSFGQQKLLELAMALMNEPKMLMLDEPTAGINPTMINGLIERLQLINQDLGITIFIIEHNMNVMMTLAEHIYCLAHGELLAQGTPIQIQNDARVLDAYLGAS